VGIRFRRSIKLGPGVRLTVGKRGLSSVSFGRRGARYTVGRGGRRTKTIGVPGTGLSYIATTSASSSGGRSSSARSARAKPEPAASPIDPATVVPRAGLLAPGREKRFRDGVVAYLHGDKPRALAAFEQASASDDRNVSDDLFAGVTSAQLERGADAIRYLEKVVASDVELPDELMQKYLPSDVLELTARVSITPNVAADVALDSIGAALMLAELYQESGRREEAIGLIQQLADANPDDEALRLSLCDLLFEDGDDEGVVESAVGAENDSDVGLAVMTLRARALMRLGHLAGALETLSAALKRTARRDPELVKDARYARADALAAAGQPKKARAALERIYAEDPHYRDVAERLRETVPA
jgi:tetratricopeptide (TPR) repeat protein